MQVLSAKPHLHDPAPGKKEKDGASDAVALDRKKTEKECLTTLKRKRGLDGMSTVEQERPYPDPTEIYQKSSPPNNVFEGDLMSRQLDESLEAFLSRLKPSATTIEAGPWIRIANPHASNKGIYRDQPHFIDEGNDLLGVYMARKRRLEEQSPSSAPRTITKKLNPEREWLEESLEELAKKCSVTIGKWMLFPMPNEVDEIWAIVAKGTLEGRLGSQAKVATDASDGKPERLICVYTEDFTDVKDVKRVLKEMNRLGLVAKGRTARCIYYKTDAYTYLDIRGNNEYKLRASKYSSKDMLPEIYRDDM